MDAVMTRAVVPIVGSGVSVLARAPGDPTLDPTVDMMQALLGRRLVESVIAAEANQDDEGAFTAFCNGVYHGQLGVHPGRVPCGYSFTTFVRQFLQRRDGEWDASFRWWFSPARVELARLCEVLRWWAGPEAVVEAARIADFEKLCTLPAHRAMARLVREGLITEIITTNYDLCIERALRNTLLPEERRNDRGGASDDKGWHPVVVRCAAEYRERGIRRREDDGRPTLRLYKINGCAERLRKRHADANDRDDRGEYRAACEEILLTEPQLHAFGERRWAEDLLRDRGRTSAFCMTGFGSDEPQVRHTYLSIVTELRHQRQLGYRNGSGPGATPWVVAFDDRFAYPQVQLLHAYAENGSHRPARMTTDPHDNYFLGPDASSLERPTSEGAARPSRNGLPADLFWVRTMEAAWGRLLEEVCGRKGPVAQALRDLGAAHPMRILDDLVGWLYPRERGWFGREFGRFEGLVCESPAGLDRNRPWMKRALPALGEMMLVASGRRVSGEHPCEQDHYPALHDDPVLVVLLLAVVRAARGNVDDQGSLLFKLADPPTLLLRWRESELQIAVRTEEAQALAPMVEGTLCLDVRLPRLYGRGGSDSRLGPAASASSAGELPMRRVTRVVTVEAGDLVAAAHAGNVLAFDAAALRRYAAAARVPRRRARLEPLQDVAHA